MEYYIAEICLFSFDYETSGFILCDGRSLRVNQNIALYALIGNKFGGDSTNFNIPNMLGLEPVPGMNYYICVNGIFPSRG